MTWKISSFIRFFFNALLSDTLHYNRWGGQKAAIWLSRNADCSERLRPDPQGGEVRRRLGGLRNGCATWRGLQRTVAEQDGRCLLLLLTLISTSSSSSSSSPEKPPTPGAGSSTAPWCPRVQDFSSERTTFLTLLKSRFHISKGNGQSGRSV